MQCSAGELLLRVITCIVENWRLTEPNQTTSLMIKQRERQRREIGGRPEDIERKLHAAIFVVVVVVVGVLPS